MTPTYRQDREAELLARIAELEAEVERLQRPGLWTRFGMWLWGGDVPWSREPRGIFEAIVSPFFPIPEGHRSGLWAEPEVKLSGEVVLPTGKGLPAKPMSFEKAIRVEKARLLDEVRDPRFLVNDGLSGLGDPLLEPLPKSAAGIPLPGALRDPKMRYPTVAEAIMMDPGDPWPLNRD